MAHASGYPLTFEEAKQEAAKIARRTGKSAFIQRRPFDGRCNVMEAHPGTWMVPVYAINATGAAVDFQRG